MNKKISLHSITNDPSACIDKSFNSKIILGITEGYITDAKDIPKGSAIMKITRYTGSYNSSKEPGSPYYLSTCYFSDSDILKLKINTPVIVITYGYHIEENFVKPLKSKRIFKIFHT